MITSGGGFATQLPRPSYQTSAVATYFTKVTIPPPEGYGKGKGIPDVSLLGTDYTIVNADNPDTEGSVYASVSGTSASTPVVAAMITLVNDTRLNNGQSTLGWIHPSLYQNYALFTNDITIGNNFCTEQTEAGVPPTCCPYGFYAADGWDPTTGLGSINFQAFYDFYTSAQCKHILAPYFCSYPSVTRVFRFSDHGNSRSRRAIRNCSKPTFFSYDIYFFICSKLELLFCLFFL